MVDSNEFEIGTDDRPPPENEDGRQPDNRPETADADGLEDELPEADGEDADDSVEDELEKAREHADPTRGDKVVDGGDRVSTEEGGNPQE
jgi:hypothetical protein